MSELSQVDMEEQRLCIACGAALSGPLEPGVTLSRTGPAGQSENGLSQVLAWAWICPGCGLVHWYAEDEFLDQSDAVAHSEEVVYGKPDTSYERRAKMLHMLRRVRRM